VIGRTNEKVDQKEKLDQMVQDVPREALEERQMLK
jgi:hypothetical protein